MKYDVYFILMRLPTASVEVAQRFLEFFFNIFFLILLPFVFNYHENNTSIYSVKSQRQSFLHFYAVICNFKFVHTSGNFFQSSTSPAKEIYASSRMQLVTQYTVL